MAAYRQFVVYKLVQKANRLEKFPCDFRTGAVVSAHDPQYWTDARTALAAATTFGQSYGLAFVFTESDPFFFVDLDDAAQDGQWKPHVTAICNLLAGAAIEISASGNGLHIFGVGQPPAHRCRSKYGVGELYHAGRFVALTGTGAVGNAATDCSAALPILVDTYWAPNETAGKESEWTTGPVPEWRGPKDDDELIRRALASRSPGAAFGNHASFGDLWNCNLDVLARAYPDSTQGRVYNLSGADSALAQHLAFWTGKDCERIERMMRKSALVRDKWGREDYLPRTIKGVVARQYEVLTDKAIEPVARDPLKAKLVEGATFANTEEQIELFVGCVYVQDAHRVMIPGGILLKPDQFKVAYGGYTFTMDGKNEKVTKDAWEAFTQNQAYRCPRTNSTSFRPDLQPGAIVERDGMTFVNTYVPVDVPRKVGDVTPFITHLAKLIPNEQDRHILLCYMAACVQHQGHKFQWAPLIQGAPGNGKSLFSRCVAEAIGRRYVHWPKASKLSAQFNGWMLGKTFFAVEDIYVPDHKRDVVEELKPMITGGDGLEIESKGIDQISADVCGNFIFNCNNQSDLPKSNDDRRYAIFHTAQQCAPEVVRDGMDGDYFPKLYDWLRDEGYAIVSELLWTYPIPRELNPAVTAGGLLHRAPDTSSTAAAIKASRGGVEQEIAEAIEQGLPGFCGGWVSSIMLERLLDRLGAARRITHARRRQMLQEMGYGYHPALVDGRVNNLVMPDSGKPRLFVRKNSQAAGISVAADAAKAYEQANNTFAFRA